MKHLTDVVIVHVGNTALRVFLFCNLHIVSYFIIRSLFWSVYPTSMIFSNLRFALYVCLFILLSIQRAFVIVNYFIGVNIIVIIVYSSRNLQRRTHIRIICGNKMPTRCNRGFYCSSYCLLNMFRASLCPSSGAQEYYTVVAACGISCCGFQVAGQVWS